MTGKGSSARPGNLPTRGLWDASRGAYVRGAVVAAIVGTLLPAMGVWSELTRGGWGADVLMGVMVLWAGALLLFIPLASWVAWFTPPPGMSASLRWLRLTVVASIVSVVPLAVLLMVLDAAETWLWIAPPMAILHALWTGLFLLGMRR